MGDRVLMQCRTKSGEFGPVVYCHWAGSEALAIVERLRAQMGGRKDDIAYATARLVQAAIDGDKHATGFGVWNAEAVLVEKDTHGDAGIVLIDVSDYSVELLGGYLAERGAS